MVIKCYLSPTNLVGVGLSWAELGNRNIVCSIRLSASDQCLCWKEPLDLKLVILTHRSNYSLNEKVYEGARNTLYTDPSRD